MGAGRNRTPVCAVYASSTARALTSVMGALFSQGGAVMEARKAYFMVRAQVPNESDRAKFDQWYGTHHLPLAMDKFHCEKGEVARHGVGAGIHPVDRLVVRLHVACDGILLGRQIRRAGDLHANGLLANGRDIAGARDHA